MTTTTIETYSGKDMGYVHTLGKDVPPRRVKHAIVKTAATDEDAYVLSVDISLFNMSNVIAVRGINHNTANSVLVLEAPTTTVSGTTLAITIGGSGAGLRSYLIVGEEA